ncbi:unnamed protein product [Spirodela intermedia]|uniref:Uncharacterized protein n=1 Tax=Spirodela intermedia TaxID=51605 RepID=A0A7I8JMU6_SPIIN|nr:unnamed protein product [Spirodela intermedia]CAA6671420.1 unnamed protein product [Spirodela intermedia]
MVDMFVPLRSVSVCDDPDAQVSRTLTLKRNSLVSLFLLSSSSGRDPWQSEEAAVYGASPAVGIHRYVFVLFKQMGVFPPVPPPAPLRLGLPVATVYFNAQKEPASRKR